MGEQIGRGGRGLESGPGDVASALDDRREREEGNGNASRLKKKQ